MSAIVFMLLLACLVAVPSKAVQNQPYSNTMGQPTNQFQSHQIVPHLDSSGRFGGLPPGNSLYQQQQQLPGQGGMFPNQMIRSVDSNQAIMSLLQSQLQVQQQLLAVALAFYHARAPQSPSYGSLPYSQGVTGPVSVTAQKHPGSRK